jgi:hypothetical protein
MIKKIGFISMALVLLLTSCSNQSLEETNIEGIPIRVHRDDGDLIDFGLLLDEIDENVHRIFPDGEYQGVVLFTNCANLPNGDGRLAVDYLRTKKGILGTGTRVYRIYAGIDIANGTLNISSEDVTNYYPYFGSYFRPTKEALDKVLTIARDYLNEINVEDCEVTITQLEDQWDILCDPVNASETKCDFRIDATSYEITDNNKKR